MKGSFCVVTAAGALVFQVQPAKAVFDITTPTTDWTIVPYIGTNQTDYFNDQQTGQAEADIVGNAGNPAYYYKFDGGGTLSTTDGTIGFRVRLGSDLPQAGSFGSVLFVGIDGNSDGALDIFLGADNTGGTPLLKIWDAGTGLNNSPSTTTINAPANQITYAETALNYGFVNVTAAVDPTATSFDLDGDGTTDRLLSFAMPFADVVTEMNRLAGITISESSSLCYVVATATQQNSLNQDLNGIPKTFDGTLTWQELGGLTPGVGVPEPNATGIIGIGLAILAFSWNLRRPH